MHNRDKIQSLIEEGAIIKIDETKLKETELTRQGKQETFRLTKEGEKNYHTIENLNIAKY